MAAMAISNVVSSSGGIAFSSRKKPSARKHRKAWRVAPENQPRRRRGGGSETSASKETWRSGRLALKTYQASKQRQSSKKSIISSEAEKALAMAKNGVSGEIAKSMVAAAAAYVAASSGSVWQRASAGMPQRQATQAAANRTAMA